MIGIGHSTYHSSRRRRSGFAVLVVAIKTMADNTVQFDPPYFGGINGKKFHHYCLQ